MKRHQKSLQTSLAKMQVSGLRGDSAFQRWKEFVQGREFGRTSFRLPQCPCLSKDSLEIMFVAPTFEDPLQYLSSRSAGQKGAALFAADRVDQMSRGLGKGRHPYRRLR